MIVLLVASGASSASMSWQLNNIFSTISTLEHKPGSTGQLTISDDGRSITKSVTTCFSSGFCGGEVNDNFEITSISGNSVALKDLSNGDTDNITILLSDTNHLVLLRTLLFSDLITIEDWGYNSVNTNLAQNYYLSSLFMIASGLVIDGKDSTGSLIISADGSSVQRNLMVCNFLDGCGFPSNQTLEVTVVPGRKLFLRDASTGSISENIIILAEYENIILFEKSRTGGGIITIWKPAQ